MPAVISVALVPSAFALLKSRNRMRPSIEPVATEPVHEKVKTQLPLAKVPESAVSERIASLLVVSIEPSGCVASVKVDVAPPARSGNRPDAAVPGTQPCTELAAA